MTSLLLAAACTAATCLNMFVGTWKSHGETAPGGAAIVKTTGQNTCAWSSAEHIFLVCDGTFVNSGDATTHHQLAIYMYDVPSKSYQFAGMDTANLFSPDLSFDGVKTWTYFKKFTDRDGKTKYNRTLNIFDTPNHYAWRVETSDDNVTWKLIVSGESEHPTP